MTITPMIPTPPLLEFISISHSSAVAANQPYCGASWRTPASCEGRTRRRSPNVSTLIDLLATTQDLPWHRVVRAGGTMQQAEPQRELMRAEGIAMRGYRVDLR